MGSDVPDSIDRPLLIEGRSVVGIKQSLKAVRDGSASKVYIAEDADRQIVSGLEALCGEMGLPVERVQSKDVLGEACGIDCSASAVAVLTEDHSAEPVGLTD